MSNSNEKQKSGMIEIRDVLKNEFQRFSSINTVLKETSNEFNVIDDTYKTYGNEMDISKNHLLKLKRREFFENLFIYIGFVIFFMCVTYVMLKRFPLHRIVFFFLNLIYDIIGFVWSVKNVIIGNIFSKGPINIQQNITYMNSTNSTNGKSYDL